MFCGEGWLLPHLLTEARQHWEGSQETMAVCESPWPWDGVQWGTLGGGSIREAGVVGHHHSHGELNMPQPCSQDFWEKTMDRLLRGSHLPFFLFTAKISSDMGAGEHGGQLHAYKWATSRLWKAAQVKMAQALQQIKDKRGKIG